MNRFIGLIVIGIFVTAIAPTVMAQDSDHVEVGAFVDYFRLGETSPARNYLGLGGRVAFNVHRDIQLEAEMAYDFKRNYTATYNDGVNSTTVDARFRTLHGLFGPKFQTGAGPFRFFVTAKAGFDNFSFSNANAPDGFTSAVGLNSGRTDFAVYPGAGIEAFAGPIGVRLEAGDEVYFDNGGHNNLKVTIGPQLRF
jgi:hypothetical protein